MKNALKVLALSLYACGVNAQPVLPAEFDQTGDGLDRIFALGGVGSFQVSQSNEIVYENGSFQLDIGFNSSGVFSFSSVGLGVLATTQQGFQIDPNADTFSVTVSIPNQLPGGLELVATLRDDDNNDGQIDVTSDDDEWVSPAVMLSQGTAVINIPTGQFTLGNAGVGNGVFDYTSGPVGGLVLTFQTSTALPGGRIESPVTLYIDHAGVYVGDQTLPGGGDCLADTNGDGIVSPTDFNAWINAFNNNLPACDQNADGACTPTDFNAWIANFNAGC